MQTQVTTAYLERCQYMGKVKVKTHIILHHTASGSISSVINAWHKDKAPVATEYIIGRDGKVLKVIPDYYWAFGLGLVGFKYRDMWESQAVQIELVSYGFLEPKKDGEKTGYWSEAKNGFVPDEEVCALDKPFRSYKYFHKYTQEQLQALEMVLKDISQRYHIKLNPGEIDTFFENKIYLLQQVSPSIYVKKTEKTVYTHVNFRDSKTDCFPQPELIDLLKRL